MRPRPASPSSTPRLGPGLAALEGTERALFEKKRRIRQALEEGKPIPTELRNEEHELRRQIDLEDQQFQTFWKKRISSSCKMPISSLFFFSFETSGSMYA